MRNSIGALKTAPLKYLLLHLNSQQTIFQFEFLPVDPEDNLLRSLRGERGIYPIAQSSELHFHTCRERHPSRLWGNREVCRECVRADLPAFANRLEEYLKGAIAPFDLADQSLPNDFILLSMARFGDHFYSVAEPHIRVIALGHWNKHVAPPSPVEAFIILTIRHAVALRCPEFGSNMHFGTKGCLCDFTQYLDEARYKVLHGLICVPCRQMLDSIGAIEVAAGLTDVLNTGWLGKAEESESPAAIAAKMGYPLFVTRGLKPTVMEQIRATLVDEGVKEITKYIIAFMVAAALFWLGAQVKKVREAPDSIFRRANSRRVATRVFDTIELGRVRHQRLRTSVSNSNLSSSASSS
jgi:hypothetical protein